MKKTLKISIAFIAVFILTTAVCFGQNVNSVEELRTYLNSQPANTPNNPIKVSINANEQMFEDITDAIFKSGKYVSLTLSGNTLKTIPDRAFAFRIGIFAELKNLVGITIPNSVTSIGRSAFSNCEGLTSVTLPNNLTSIGETAFSACKKLSSITIPNSVTSIGERAFQSCNSLASITIPDSVTSIRNETFTGSGLTSITIPNSITNIGYRAFYQCYSLNSVTIPNTVTNIGDDAFLSCSRLTAINVNIGNTAYSSQDGILYNKNKTILIQYPQGKTETTAFIVPNSVTRIRDSAFSLCKSITSVTIPNSVTEIGNSAFSYCTSLTAINVDSGNTAYSSQDGILYNKNKTFLIQYPQGKIEPAAFTVPNSVTRIGDSAFGGSNINSVSIPNSVTSIGFAAFYRCKNLSSINIPSSVISIGGQAFADCENLTSVTFATGSNIAVANFGDNAFIERYWMSDNSLRTAYSTGKAGTYTRTNNRWTKQ